MNFEYFQIQKWMLQTVRLAKKDEKNWVICLVSMFFFLVMVLKLSKKGIFFFTFVLTSARNLGLLKYFTYMYLEDLATHFQKMVLFIMLWLTVLKILVFEVENFLLIFYWVSIFFDISIANISWTMAQISISHSIFWKRIMRTFSCIYVNCFNRLRFFADFSTKL